MQSVEEWKGVKDLNPLATLKQIEQITDPAEGPLDSALIENEKWAETLLKDQNYSTKLDQLQSSLDDIDEDSSAWLAANSLLQCHTLRSAISRDDYLTATLIGFQLADFRWQAYFAQVNERELADQKLVEDILQSEESADLETEIEIASYQAAINTLSKKYEHCNVNALRLLLANQLGVSKQRLDDLDITPSD